ncbi:MAG: hypothetical protein IJB57_08350, partial [Clostridia bacterium]|nr:hypothetical protein [Clostridia bacterium]
MKTTIRLLSAILCLVMLLGCVTIQAADEFEKLKADYISYVNDHYPLYYPVNNEDIMIRGYYGNHNGYDIV